MSKATNQWGLYFPYFQESEFVCKCEKCAKEGKAYVHKDLMDKLLKARLLADIPFVITSGCRCDEHNKKVNGSVHSDHLYQNNDCDYYLTCGVDIKVKNDITRERILCALFTAGFHRIGIAEKFIHVAIPIRNHDKVAWLYKLPLPPTPTPPPEGEGVNSKRN